MINFLLKQRFVVTILFLGRLFNDIINHLLIKSCATSTIIDSGLKNKQVMRKFSLVLVAAMLLSVGGIFANNPKKANPEKTLSTQIAELLDNNPFIVADHDLTAQVKFMLNNKKEIIVISVDTDNELLEGFVKSRLNYKKVDSKDCKRGETYTVPVRITEA